MSAIKELVLSLKDQSDVPVGLQLDDPAEIRLAMERKLLLQQKAAPATLPQPTQGEARIEDMQRFGQLLQHKAIDRKKLWQGIETVLAHQQTATLSEIIEANGLEQGIAEVVAYYDSYAIGLAGYKPSKVP